MAFLSAIAGLFTKGVAKTVMSGTNEILKSVDSLHTSAEEKSEIRKSVIETVLSAQTEILVAEAKAGGIAALWRPLTALSFVALILCNYALFPMIAVIWPQTADVVNAVVLPPDLWGLLKIMIGGYAGGRTLEKITGMAVPLMSGRQMLKKLKLEAKLNK